MDSARSVALALFVVVVALPGCSSLFGAPGTEDPADTATATPIPVETPTPTPTPTPGWHKPSVTYSTLDSNLAENERPHELDLVNLRDETAVAVTLNITRAEGEAVFNKTFHLAPNEDQLGVLDYKANYTVRVTADNQTVTKHIQPSMFDCNAYSTTFAVDIDEIHVRTLATASECPTESPE